MAFGLVLKHYFPTKQPVQSKQNISIVPNSLIQIDNKYYSVTVQCSKQSWAVSASFSSSNVSQSCKKFDFIIFLIDNKPSQTEDMIPIEHIYYEEVIDQVIDRYNPEEYVILLNYSRQESKEKKTAIQFQEVKWEYEETIMEKCNNFVQIVKADLAKMKEKKPEWARGKLLTNSNEDEGSQDDEEYHSIFNILDHLETTRWATLRNHSEKAKGVGAIVTKSQEKQELMAISQKENSQGQCGESQPASESQETSSNNEQKVEEKELTEKNEIVPLETKQAQDTNDVENEEQTEKTEEQLEKEMKEFESMMSSMMAFKMESQTLPLDERRTKAENLFMKMFNTSNAQ